MEDDPFLLGFVFFGPFSGSNWLFVSGRVWTTSPGPKEASRCFTAVATLEGEDKGNAREATEDRMMRLGLSVGCLIVCCPWLGLLYR